MEAGVRDKLKELEAKHAEELEQLRTELENKYREVLVLSAFVFYMLCWLLFNYSINPFTANPVKALHFAIPV